MRYLKTYEKHYHNEPNEGDYVICKKEDYNNDFLNNFYQTTIGKIAFVQDSSPNRKYYNVIYEIPPNMKLYFKQYHQTKNTRQEFEIEEILHYSKNREYLETILDANKYNL